MASTKVDHYSPTLNAPRSNFVLDLSCLFELLAVEDNSTDFIPY